MKLHLVGLFDCQSSKHIKKEWDKKNDKRQTNRQNRKKKQSGDGFW